MNPEQASQGLVSSDFVTSYHAVSFVSLSWDSRGSGILRDIFTINGKGKKYWKIVSHCYFYIR